MRKVALFILMMIVGGVYVEAQQIVPLWKDKPAKSNGLTGGEKVDGDDDWIVNVSVPELHVYKADKNPNGKAVVICPGGGYAGVAFNHEGKMMARWLNDRGITAVVLKYRMPNKNSDIPLADVQEAMRYVRRNAESLGVDINKVGIAGFSAGGHLAATASTHYATEGISTRPDFSILFYPVITMQKMTHGGSRSNLLGDNPSDSDIYRFSAEKQVTVNTPPTILLLSDDDDVVPVDNSVEYYEALKKNDIPAAMYTFPEGGHGWGFRENFRYNKQMEALLQMWLEKL